MAEHLSDLVGDLEVLAGGHDDCPDAGACRTDLGVPGR